MTCMMLSRSCAEEYDLNTPSAKLNHRRFRALLKKLRRKKIRQKAAQERDRLLQVEEKVPLSPCQEEQEQEEQEKQRQHELWLEREAEAQREFKQRCRLEEERETVLANRAKGASQEESLEKVLAQLPVASPSLPPTSREESWHNPPAPSTYAPAEPCPFYLKTGACRFGDWCSRAHPRPVVSRTLLLRGLYSHLSLEQHHGDDSLETDERELQAHFEAFFWDVLEELRRAGTVCQLRVCRNLEPHLRGNVYVQYSSEEEARRALTMLNGRWYAGRPVSCEFSPVDRWKTAVCGLHHHSASIPTALWPRGEDNPGRHTDHIRGHVPRDLGQNPRTKRNGGVTNCVPGQEAGQGNQSHDLPGQSIVSQPEVHKVQSPSHID
ncbi:U2 small nuclear ribonucleoprotein auxiliary factor 35 kDa subunit-related protein 2-like isoform X2 [Dermacentor albipictus]|uniref:U2 small nuclear ribonucleoprotein auxiliary factor 35 kDa subunit-related protein 2-like isoform X2 n=1 Tax=Dermacentor albipictus TaxID=60249 RepID=UPI0038FC1605